MRRLSLLCVALVATLASGCATTSQRTGYTADQLKSLGEKALLAHDTPTALKFLSEAENRRPDDAAIEYDLALAYSQRGFEARALQHIKKALKIKPDYPEALNTLGYMYATRGKFDLARAAFEKALNDPFYQTPQIAALNLGELYERRGDSRKALSYYKQAVKLDPQSAEAWYRIGRISEKAGNNDEARHAYETAVQDSPNMAEAYLRLGIMSYRAGHLKDAAGSFSEVERIAPDTDPADEAQRYLEKINNPLNPSKPLSVPRHS